MNDFNDKSEGDNKSAKLQKVVDSLNKVSPEINQLAFAMSNSMSDLILVNLFNQTALDLFGAIDGITKSNPNGPKCDISTHKLFFDQAIKINNKLPIDKFSINILEFADYIYSEDDAYFLQMTIPDGKLSLGTEFNLIRSETFKQLWLSLSDNDKTELKEKIILLTSYAHAFFYKTVMNNRQQ